ncbi:MAG TPA: tetratricopeptide repeat protein [Blastocatellia bacterium]|nr:tetratricopeptide repeat protein [Blastocatellia bacterium]
MRLKLLALASVFALCWPGSLPRAGAQTRQEPGSKTWAVVIGVSRYPKLAGGQQLQFADSDAMAFAESLKKAGASPSNIRLLVGPDATIASIKSAIGNWLARSASEADTVYIFFSGHGLAERDFGEAYLLAYDSDTANPYGTALSIGDMRNALAGRVRAGRVLVIADSIRRDLFPDDERAASTEVFSRAFNQLVSARTGISALLGSGPGEFAREGRAWGGQGVFTKFLIDALSGAADSNHDSLITAAEAFEHVAARVAQETSDKQHPWQAGPPDSGLVLARAAPAPALPLAPQSGTKPSETATTLEGRLNARPPDPEKIAEQAEAQVAQKTAPKPDTASASATRATETAASPGNPGPPAAEPSAAKSASNDSRRAELKAPPRVTPRDVQPGPGKNPSATALPPSQAPGPEKKDADALLAKAEPVDPEPAKPMAAKPEAARAEMMKPEMAAVSPPPARPAPAPPVTSTVSTATVRSRAEPVMAGLPKIEASAAPSPLSLQVEAAISSNRLIEPRGGSAWELFQRLAQEQPSSPEVSRLKPLLASALDSSGRAIIGSDVTADNVSEKVDEFKRAGQMFSRARALAPSDSKIADLEKLSAAQALLALQFFEEAERSLSQIQGERSASLENTLGLIYLGRLDSFRAERAFKRAAELRPEWATPLYNLSVLYRQEKNEAALETLERASSLDPQNGDILHALGDEYFAREKWQQALETFRKAVALRPGDDALHTKLGHALFSLGQRDEANREYQKAQELRSRKQ